MVVSGEGGGRCPEGVEMCRMRLTAGGAGWKREITRRGRCLEPAFHALATLAADIYLFIY